MPRLRLALVGTGRAAAGLAPFLSQGGAELVAVVGRSQDAVDDLARTASTGGRRPPAAFTFERLPAGLGALPPADGWILAVRDDAIAEVDERLARLSAYAGARWAAHLSGALPAAQLAAARSTGLAVASLHPLASFPPAHAGRGAPRAPVLPPLFVLEGDRAAVADLAAWLGALGARAREVDPDRKPLYHAAASLSANFGLALISLAAELAALAGIPPDEAERALAALAAGAMENASQVGLAPALTGPIRRGDVGTVRRHLEALAGLPPRFREAYATLGREAVRLARRAGAPTEALSAVEAELEKASSAGASATGGPEDARGGGRA